MKPFAAWVGVLICLCVAHFADAQTHEITGYWQGTMRIGSSEFRDLLHIRKAKTGELSATIEFTDTGGKVVPVTAISVSESRLIFRLDPWKASYEGTISPDASAISGVWKDAGKDRILNFRRSTAPKKAHDMPSDINGYWTGTIKYEQPCGDHTIKGESLYVFHIFNTTEGLTATWDVPYSGDFGWRTLSPAMVLRWTLR